MNSQAYVKSIAQELTDVYNGIVYYCSNCGHEHKIVTDDPVECSKCGTELEPMTLYDFFNDVYDIEYRVSSKHDDIKSVSIMVACGGPNIYIDTADNKVKCYWWTDYADEYISSEIGDEITEMFNEYWHMS